MTRRVPPPLALADVPMPAGWGPLLPVADASSRPCAGAGTAPRADRLAVATAAPRRAWLAPLGSVVLHGAVLAGILFLLPDALRTPDREHGVEMVWQDEGVDSAAAAAAPMSIPAPPAPEAVPPPAAPPPPARAAALPPPTPTPPPPLPQQIARLAPPPSPITAPPAPPDRPVEAPLPPEAPPRETPLAVAAPPPPPPQGPPTEIPPPPRATEPPPPERPVAEAPTEATAEAAIAEAMAEPMQMAEILPLPPPAMPLPLAPLRTAEARPARPPAAPMRPMPGIAPLGQPVDGDTQTERVGATRVVGATVPPGLLDGVRNAQPEYPSSSRQRGEQGVVALVLQVSAAGQVVGVEIGRTSGFPQLDDAAKKAALRWRFRPATRDGVPIEGTIRTQVHFRLVQ